MPRNKELNGEEVLASAELVQEALALVERFGVTDDKNSFENELFQLTEDDLEQLLAEFAMRLPA